MLGSGEFVERLRQEAAVRPVLPPKVSLADLRKLICEVFKVLQDAILRRTRGGPASEARAVFCYTAVRLVGMAGTEVGPFLSMGSSAVRRAVSRGELILQDNPIIKESLDKALGKD